MHDGVIPGSFTANVIKRIPNEEFDNKDMKSENRRKAPARRRNRRASFGDWLRYRARAEEEEYLDDEELDDEELDDEELDDEEFDEYSNPEEDDDLSDDEDDPEEFDDFEEEKELDFEDDDERAPFPITKDRDDGEGEDLPLPAGRFKDFYRMGDEEQEEAPGGFEPGQAVGTASAMGQKVKKIDKARTLMRQMASKPGITRDEMIQELMRQLPTTESTATSYYEDIAREMGLMGDGSQQDAGEGGGMGDDGPIAELPGDNTQELSQEQIDAQDPDAQGITRTVDKAHLVYKRQQEDGKFEELWIYNSGDKLDDALNVRREILAGTDIPRGHTKSEDGQQSYTLTTMGNAQILHITGLAN